MIRLPVIETERLRLRPLQMEDGPHVFAIFSDEHLLATTTEWSHIGR